MEPVRVKIVLNPEKGTVDDPWNIWNKEFHGKTGTVVYVSSTGWGGYSTAVELDEPTTTFGQFAKMVYVLEDYGRDLLGIPEDVEAFRELVALQGGRYHDNFRAWHDKHGDPLPWSVVSEMIDEREQAIALQNARLESEE